MPTLPSDEQLIARARRGDTEAATTLYRRHRDWVLTVALRIAGNEADAHDVLQDTFLYLFRKLPRLRLTARLRTFLYPAVKHLAIAARRRRERFTGGAAVEEPAMPASGEGDTPRDELAWVMAALPEEQREVMLLRFVDDLSLEEIATALSVPTGTVKSRLHHALRRLREDPRTRRYFLEQD